MKIAFPSSTIVLAGPDKGTFRNHFATDYAPNLERKGPPEASVVQDYSNKLIRAEDCTVKLISSTVRAEHTKRMKVRGGKAGPNGKKRTDFDLLAKGTGVYAFGKLQHIQKNEGFNKFGNVQIPVVRKGQEIRWQGEPNTYLVITEPDAKGYADLQCKNNLQLSGNFYVKDPDIIIIHAPVQEQRRQLAWAYNAELKPVKRLNTFFSLANGKGDMLETTNRLIRQAMLFKGIDFNRVERELAKNGKKPITYILNTLVELNTNTKDSEGRDIMRRFKIHKCTVKLTWREGEKCGIFFSSQTCKPVTLWLQSLKLHF